MSTAAKRKGPVVAKAKPVVQFNAPASAPKFNPSCASGAKYLRDIAWATADGKADVYSVLAAFKVTCPGRQHAIKKLLCAGLRNKGSVLQDLREAVDATERAIQLEVGLREAEAAAALRPSP